MSSAFTSLVSKIENYYADQDYTTRDAEHLSRLAILEYANEKNALVASARQVPSDDVNQIINVAIKQNLVAEPSEWMVFAANAVDNVLNYAHEGIIASGLGAYTDFLPLGHPSRTNQPAMTASAASRLSALWVAGDPRIGSEQARLDVYAAYATKPGSVEAEYAGAKLSALVSAGYVPEDVVMPITAAFKMSFAMRSAIAKALAAVRRRHSDGRFAEEFGRLRGFFSRKDGSVFSKVGRIVGAIPNTNIFEVEFPGDADIPKGLYQLDASRTKSVKAVLSGRALKKVKGLKSNDTIGMPTESEKRIAVPLDEFLSTKTDSPNGWTKNEDGSFTSKSGHTARPVESAPAGDYMTEGTGESGQIDPNQPMFELTDKDGKTLGVAQDWAGINKISMSYDALNGKSESAPEEPGLDQNAGDGGNWYDGAIDFDHLSDPSNWKGFKEGTHEYVSPDGKLELNWEPDGEPDMGNGGRDLSGISVSYDGQPVGSYLASFRDLEEGDIEDGLKDLFKKTPWFSPDNLLKTSDDGNTYEFSNDEGAVSIGKSKGRPVKFEVTKEIAQGMIDENLEHSYYDTKSYDTEEEAHKAAEDFAKLLQDPSKVQDLLYQDWQDKDYGFDQNAGDGTEAPKLSEEGKAIAKGLGDHKFFLEEDADGNITGGQDTYTSPDGRVQVKFHDGSWFDEEKGYVSWDQMYVSVDGKPVDSIIRNKRESWNDFLDRVAAMAENGLADPNYAENKKAKREADRKAQEDFYNSPEQVNKRAQDKWEKEQAAIAEEQARMAVDKEGLLDKVDDLANKIYNDEPDDSVWVGDEDEDGNRKWALYNEEGDEIATGTVGPNYDAKDIADELRSGINEHLDQKLDELEPPAGLDQKAGETPAFLEENPDRIGLKPVPVDKLNDPKYRGLKGFEGLYSYEGADGSYGTLESDGGDDGSDKPKPTVWTATLKDKDGNVIAQKSFKENQKTQADSKATEWLTKRIADHNKSENKKSSGGFSAKQMEPATDKQYALLEELNSERDGIDPVTQEAINDALANRNMSKAQISSLFGELQKKPFKPGIDPTKPTDRQIDSLQGYLVSKELSPDEMSQILDQLEGGLDRAGMESIIAKLRRRPDRADGGFNQAAGIDSSFDDEYDSADSDVSKKIDQALADYENQLNDDGLSEEEIASKVADAEEIAEKLRDASHIADSQGVDRALMRDSTDGIFNEIANNIQKNIDALDSRAEKNVSDANQAKADEVQAAIDGEDVSFLEDLLRKNDYSEYHSDIEDALADINARNGEEGGFDQSAGSSEWTKKTRNFTDARTGRKIDSDPKPAISEVRDEIDAAIEKAVAAAKAKQAEYEAEGGGKGNSDWDDAQRIIDDFGWTARANNLKYVPHEDYIEDYISDVESAWDTQDNYNKQLSKDNRALADNWYSGADERTKSDAIDAVANYLDDLRENDPRQFYMDFFEFAKSRDDGRRVFEKPHQYVGEYADYLATEDPEQLGLILDDQNFGGSDDFGFDQATTKAPSAKMSEPATEAQYSYLKSLVDSKDGADPETLQAINEALDSKNLTKAQAGAFIGKLRDLNDKENMGQYGKPSQKMIDSVNRDVYMKGLSDEDRAAILDKLESQSKGDVSTIISRLKELPDVPGGMEKYIDSLVAKGDLEALKRLREDGRFGDYNVDLDKAISKLNSGDSGDSGFNQAAGKPNYQDDIDGLHDLVDRIVEADDNGDFSGLSFIKKDALDIDPNDTWDITNLHAELSDLYKNMRPNNEKGKQLEADLKEAIDNLQNSIETKLGPIEAAKLDPEDSWTSFEFDKAFDDLKDFFDYYYPTDVSAIEDHMNQNEYPIGDVRGGGWEGGVRQDEETGKWIGYVDSPESDSDSYSKEFDDRSDAAEWAANSLADENGSLGNVYAKLLNDGSDAAMSELIKMVGNDPKEILSAIESATGWLRSTNRGSGENAARKLDAYADRLRAIIEKNPKA